MLFDNLAQDVDQNEGREEADLLQKLLCSLTSPRTSVKAPSDTSTAHKESSCFHFSDEKKDLLPPASRLFPSRGQLHFSRQGDYNVVPNNTHMLAVSGDLLVFALARRNPK